MCGNDDLLISFETVRRISDQFIEEDILDFTITFQPVEKPLNG